MTFWSFVQIFVFCDSSERVDLKFDEIDFYQCEWYSFPPNVQRSLPIVIANTQLPVVLEAFGGLACTRETFQRVRQFLYILKVEMTCELMSNIENQSKYFSGGQWRIFLFYGSSPVCELEDHLTNGMEWIVFLFSLHLFWK